MVSDKLRLDDRESAIESIKQLGEDDLRFLNRAIVDHIKLIRSARKSASMAQFSVGDTVSFRDKEGELVNATVIRLNKKTASLVTEDDERWNVAPELLELQTPISQDLFGEMAPGGLPLNTAGPGETGEPKARTEWAGGTITMPGYVTGEGKPFRPVVTAWMDADGLVLGTTASEPGDESSDAIASLQQAIDNPMAGDAGYPTHIRIADAALIDALQNVFPSIVFEQAATPELDALAESMREGMSDSADSPITYLSDGLPPEAVASFFQASANLFKAKPWQQVPNDQCLVCINVESLGIYNAALSIIGQMGKARGFILFPGIREYEGYLIASDAIALGNEPLIPPHLALSFEDGTKLDPAMRKEIAEQHWEVNNAHAYPVLFAPDSDQMIRPITVNDLTVVEALAKALPGVLAGAASRESTWNGQQPFSETVTVETHCSDVTLTLAAPFPYELTHAGKEPGDTLMAELALAARTPGNIDHEIVGSLIEELDQRFSASPEGKKLPSGLAASSLIMDLALNFQSETIATLLPGELEDIVFSIIPHQVAIGPAEAKSIIEECRAFYRYLKRNYALPQADACLSLLGADAVKRLQAALHDTANFGIGKSILPLSGDTDFDMFSLPKMPVKPADPRATKKKRKAARKARKKNR